MQEFALIIFEVLNFVMLGLAAWYIGYRYIYPLLQQYIQADLQDWSALETKKNELAKEQDALQGLLVEEISACQLLEQKIKVWNSVLEQAHLDDQARILEHRKQQLGFLAQNKKKRQIEELKHKVIKLVVGGARQELKQFFKNPAYTQEYIAHILKQVRKV